jgi:hypothetical protein
MTQSAEPRWIVGCPDVRCVKLHDGARHPGPHAGCVYELQGWHTGPDWERYVSDVATRTAFISGNGPDAAGCRLIAAAPTMLDALREAHAGLEFAAGMLAAAYIEKGLSRRCGCADGFVCSPCKARPIILAALAAAEGRQ